MPESDPDDLRDVFLFAMIDEYLKTCNHAPSTAVTSASGQATKLSDAEVLFVFVVACASHGGHCQEAQRSQRRCGNRDACRVKAKLSRSQFNRRLWALEHRLVELLGLLASLAKAENQEFALDSFPWPVCKNVRIQRFRLMRGAQFRGYNASKREYFYGYKCNLVTAQDGRVVEFDFTPGSRSDTVAFELLSFDYRPAATFLPTKPTTPTRQKTNSWVTGTWTFNPSASATANGPTTPIAPTGCANTNAVTSKPTSVNFWPGCPNACTR